MLGEHLDKFIMVYLDNIIIYLNIKEEYKEYIKWVLKRLYNKNIPIAMEKCEDIVDWQDIESVIRLRLFLGFCNYYKKFIKKWLDKIKLFIKMTKKDELWKWDNNKMRLFKEVKQEFIKELILKIY